MKKNKERSITRVVISTGISSVVIQLLTIREFLVQFNGNEFVIALILFNWLALGGMGSLIANRITKKLRQVKTTHLCWISLWIIVLPVFQILSIRLLRDFFFIHGSSVGFYPTLAFTFFTIAPYGLLIGFALPYSLYVLRGINPNYSGTDIYMTDNLGDMVGGALFSFVLVFLFTPMQAILVAGLPLLISTYLLFREEYRSHLSTLSGAILAFAILLGGIFVEHDSISPSHGKLVHYRESRFGRIEIHQDQEQFTLLIEGTPLFSNQNITMAEETIHYPLSQINTPKQVLLISAEGKMIEELQKYHLEAVDYIEIDPEVSSALFSFNFIEKKSWLNVIHQDGRAYLAKSKKSYDAIIINLPEPETYQVNRFFTNRFFELAKDHLTANGVLSFSMQGFDNYLAEPQRQKLSSLFNTVSDYFNHVLLLPGQKIFFLCSTYPLKTDIPKSLLQNKISTQYINNFYYGNLTNERISELNSLIDPDTPKNLDNSPYLMKIMFSQWFSKFSTSPIYFFSAVTALLFICFSYITKEEFVLFSTGFMTMGSEILVIFAFQIIFGYIYFQIGLIVTVFLGGLLPGAWIGHKLRTYKKGITLLALTDTMLMVLMGLLFLILFQGGHRFPVSFYIVFGFFVSLICGCQFPLATVLKKDESSAVTRFFSADLMGAAFGTLITSVILIPHLGILWTTAGLMGLKAVSLLILALKNEKIKPTSVSLL